jgi:DNA-binding transcriptional regulator YhcF (GntR family)
MTRTRTLPAAHAVESAAWDVAVALRCLASKRTALSAEIQRARATGTTEEQVRRALITAGLSGAEDRSGAAAYLRVAASVRARIENGELQPGDRVPSVRQIVAEWGVARATAEKALRVLRTEGLVVTHVRGAGTVVRQEDTECGPCGELHPHPAHAWGMLREHQCPGHRERLGIDG